MADEIRMSVTPRNLVLAGSAILALGTFMPIVSMPIVGSMNYFNNGEGDGVVLLLLAVAAGGLAFFHRTRLAGIAGIGAALMLLWAFMRFQTMKSDMLEKMETEMADNPFRGLAEAAMQSVQLQWGWVFLVGGTALTLFGAFRAHQARSVETATEAQSLHNTDNKDDAGT